MKTYPHQEGDGIIDLVRKDEHDAVVRELEQEVRDNTELRQRLHDRTKELASWQSLTERLATALDDFQDYYCAGGTPPQEHRQQMDKVNVALAAYESAAKGNLCKTCGGSKMTPGWYPTYNDPDNIGLHPEAEPCPACQPGNLPDPLDEAVKRMGAVAPDELITAYCDGPGTGGIGAACCQVRNLLISAAKGEQP